MTDLPVTDPPVFYPLSFVEVVLDLPDAFPIVRLQEFESPYRMIHMSIGMAEGVAIAYAAKQIATPRPLTHQLMLDTFAEFGLEVVTLRITSYDAGAFAGELVVSGPRGQRSVTCRVSDGIALCLRQRPAAPITASPSVIDQAGAVG